MEMRDWIQAGVAVAALVALAKFVRDSLWPLFVAQLDLAQKQRAEELKVITQNLERLVEVQAKNSESQAKVAQSLEAVATRLEEEHDRTEKIAEAMETMTTLLERQEQRESGRQKKLDAMDARLRNILEGGAS